MVADLDKAFAAVRRAAVRARLPEVEETMWYGTPSLKVRGKGFARLKDADTLVLMCPLEEKELLMEVEPEIFFETDHYQGLAGGARPSVEDGRGIAPASSGTCVAAEGAQAARR